MGVTSRTRLALDSRSRLEAISQRLQRRAMRHDQHGEGNEADAGRDARRSHCTDHAVLAEVGVATGIVRDAHEESVVPSGGGLDPRDWTRDTPYLHMHELLDRAADCSMLVPHECLLGRGDQLLAAEDEKGAPVEVRCVLLCLWRRLQGMAFDRHDERDLGRQLLLLLLWR